jgi:O-antigen/teichoic acid export membrane protein
LRFSGDVAATFSARLLLVGLGVASSVLTARALGPGGRGILATLGALSGIGLQLGNLGLHASNTYQVSRDHSLLGGLWANSRRTSWAIGLGLALLTVALALALPGILGEIRFSLLLPSVACIPFQLLVLFGLNLLVGLGRVPLFNALEVTFRGVGVGALFVVLVVLRRDIRWVLMLNFAVAVGGAVVVSRVLGRRLRETGGASSRTDLALFRTSVGYGARAYTAALLAYLIVRSDMLLVNTLRGTSDAGIYSIAVQVADLIYLLPMSIGMVLFPRLTRHQEGDPVFAMKVTRHTAFFLLLLCLAAAILARPAVGLLYGPGFLPAVTALWWLLPGIWAYGVANQIATQLASSGMPLPAVLIWIPPLLLNVVLNLAWIPRWGINAASASSSLCYILVLVLHLALWKKRIRGSVGEALLLRRSDIREIGSLAGITGWS